MDACTYWLKSTAMMEKHCYDGKNCSFMICSYLDLKRPLYLIKLVQGFLNIWIKRVVRFVVREAVVHRCFAK